MKELDPRVPPHFLVLVPGMMGSKLRDRRTGKIVWLDFDSFPLNPFEWDDWVEQMLDEVAYPNDNLEPAGIMDRVMFMAPWARQEQYSRLLEALEQMGYCFDDGAPECNAHTFAYDWRQDIRISGRQLGDAIERWRVLHDGAPAWVIGHSMGGIAARWYIEKEGGKDFVSRLFLMASPWNGAPKALSTIFMGLDLFMRARLNPLKIRELTRRTVRSFPSAYQILPHREFYLTDSQGRRVDPFTNTEWLDDDTQRGLLADARKFNEELGNTLSVETLCFFGRKHTTVSRGIAVVDPAGLWDAITWESSPAGDGTVPETSAVHEAASQKLPFSATHGNIYVHPGVLEVLQWELHDRFLAGAGVQPPVSRNALAVAVEQEQVRPGAPVRLRASVDGEVSAAAQALLDAEPSPDSMLPERLEEVRDGRIHVQLAWQSGLPGNPPLPAVPDVVFGILIRDSETGEYAGEIRVPFAEGYYRLLSEAFIDGARIVDIDLLIVDDGAAGWSVDPETGQALAGANAVVPETKERVNLPPDRQGWRRTPLARDQVPEAGATDAVTPDG
jgi:pimeloyl-ACP methyl ester carboxylesterase